MCVCVCVLRERVCVCVCVCVCTLCAGKVKTICVSDMFKSKLIERNRFPSRCFISTAFTDPETQGCVCVCACMHARVCVRVRVRVCTCVYMCVRDHKGTGKP